jgi:hypothetical protein
MNDLKNKMNLEVDNWDATVKFSILELIDHLDEEGKKRVCDYFTYEHIFDSLERQLKHKTDLDSWDTSGWRDGASIRAFILKQTGLEPEFKKDMDSKIRSLESDVANYKKYYDWYFKLHHHGFDCPECRTGKSLMQKAREAIGDVK